MKKWIAALLTMISLLSLAACQKETPPPQGPAFYYCANEVQYSMDSVTIQAEYRQNAAADNLQQMLVKYFAGPSSEELRSPFPSDMKLVEVSQDGDTIYVTVSDALSTISGLELTLACGCITMTCMDFTGAEKVVISVRDGLLGGQKSITMDANTLLLLDTVLEGE